jgi:hypothetical protein
MWETDMGLSAPYRLRFNYSKGHLDMFVGYDRFTLERLGNEIRSFQQKGRSAVELPPEPDRKRKSR